MASGHVQQTAAMAVQESWLNYFVERQREESRTLEIEQWRNREDQRVREQAWRPATGWPQLQQQQQQQQQLQ